MEAPDRNTRPEADCRLPTTVDRQPNDHNSRSFPLIVGACERKSIGSDSGSMRGVWRDVWRSARRGILRPRNDAFGVHRYKLYKKIYLLILSI